MKLIILLLFAVANVNYSIAQNKQTDATSIIKTQKWQVTESTFNKQDELTPQNNLGAFYLKNISIYIESAHYDEALENCIKASLIFSEKADYEHLAKVNSYFAFIYAELNNTPKAIEYYKKNLNYYTSKNNHAGIIKSLNNLGNAYFVLSKLDSSLYYFKKSQLVLQKHNNPVLKAFVLSNMGKLFFRKNENVQAEKLLLQAKDILTQYNVNDLHANFNVYYNLSTFYLKQKKSTEALNFAMKTGSYVNKNIADFNNIHYLNNLFNAYLLNADYKNAALTFQKYDALREKLNIEEKAVNVERMKAQYEYELKHKLHTLKQDKRNLIYTIILVVFLLVLIISVLFALNFKNRTEALNLEKKLIETREKELEFDNHMKEKLLVHQSLEQQKVETVITSIIEKIDGMKDKFNNANDFSEIVNELKINTKPNTWEDFEYHFLQVHESFYKNLELKHPHLTNYDKRLAAMLKLRLSTKEISNLLNVTHRTIENSRTRLRKKLNLTNTKEDLSKYLEDF